MDYKYRGHQYAYPRPASPVVGSNGLPDFGVPGLTIREVMASQIMAAYASGLSLSGSDITEPIPDDQAAAIADNAAKLADFLLQRLGLDG